VRQVGAGQTRRASRFATGLAMLLLTALALAAQQRSGGTALAIRVNPEARLAPAQVTLQFRVAAGGSASVITQTALIEAWMRPALHQQVHLAARLKEFNGPSGPAAAAISFRGDVAGAAGGGQTALCAGGSFRVGSQLDLATGWDRAGKLACSVSFSLTGASNLPPVDYSGTVDLTLSAQ